MEEIRTETQHVIEEDGKSTTITKIVTSSKVKDVFTTETTETMTENHTPAMEIGFTGPVSNEDEEARSDHSSNQQLYYTRNSRGSTGSFGSTGSIDRDQSRQLPASKMSKYEGGKQHDSFGKKTAATPLLEVLSRGQDMTAKFSKFEEGEKDKATKAKWVAAAKRLDTSKLSKFASEGAANETDTAPKSKIVKRESKKLDTDKLVKFASEGSERATPSKAPATPTTKKLDSDIVSVFHKNEMAEEAENVPPKTQLTSTPSKKLSNDKLAKFASPQPDQDKIKKTEYVLRYSGSVQDAMEKTKGRETAEDKVSAQTMNCKVCTKRVYPMEKLSVEKKIYHKNCFKCFECSTNLRLDNYVVLNEKLYCKPHYNMLMKLKGHAEGDLENFSIKEAMLQAREEAASELEDAMETIHDLRDVRARFNDEQQEREFPKSEIISPDLQSLKVARARFEAGEEETRISQKMYPDDFPIVRKDEGVVENEPEIRMDVVREDYSEREEPKSLYGGLGNIRNQFEQGEVSNIKMKEKKKEVIKRSAGEHVVESEPQMRDDVVRESTQMEEQRRFEGLGNVRSMFEKGNVHNAEVAAKREAILPRRFDAEDGQEERVLVGADRGQIAESEPEIRDDVMRESQKQADPMRIRGGMKSLRSMFEQGKVSNVEMKERPKLERVPRSLDSYQSPADRDEEEDMDSVGAAYEKEEPLKLAGMSSLKDRFEKCQVSNAEVRVSKIKLRPKSFIGEEPTSPTQHTDANHNNAYPNGTIAESDEL